MLVPAAKCHLPPSVHVVREELLGSKQGKEIRKPVSLRAGHRTDSCPAAGRTQRPNARSHGATLLLPFSLVTPVPAASAEHGLGTRSCSRLGVASLRCKQPGPPRYLCWEERAGPCSPAPLLWGETPMPSCF